MGWLIKLTLDFNFLKENQNQISYDNFVRASDRSFIEGIQPTNANVLVYLIISPGAQKHTVFKTECQVILDHRKIFGAGRVKTKFQVQHISFVARKVPHSADTIAS